MYAQHKPHTPRIPGKNPNDGKTICHASGINCDPHWSVWLPRHYIEMFMQQSGHDGSEVIVVESPADILAQVRSYKPQKSNPFPLRDRAWVQCTSKTKPKPIEIMYQAYLNCEEVKQMRRLTHTRGTCFRVMQAPESDPYLHHPSKYAFFSTIPSIP